MLYSDLLGLRGLFNDATEPPWWADQVPDWSAVLDQQALFAAVGAGVAAEIPVALVQWQSFDEARFWGEALRAGEVLPAKHQEIWRAAIEQRRR